MAEGTIPSLIGWVYVEAVAPLSAVLPPLAQCVDDSLRRIGAVDVTVAPPIGGNEDFATNVNQGGGK